MDVWLQILPPPQKSTNSYLIGKYSAAPQDYILDETLDVNLVTVKLFYFFNPIKFYNQFTEVTSFKNYT